MANKKEMQKGDGLIEKLVSIDFNHISYAF